MFAMRSRMLAVCVLIAVVVSCKPKEEQHVTLQNQASKAYEFTVTIGGQTYKQSVDGGKSWDIPAPMPPPTEWITVNVADTGGFCSQAQNARTLLFNDDGGAYVLNCEAGDGGGGCNTQQCASAPPPTAPPAGQTVTLKNSGSKAYDFTVTQGSNTATQTVDANSSWQIPFSVVGTEWLNVEVKSLQFCYQAENAGTVEFVDEGGAYALNCQPGDGGGGCDTQPCPPSTTTMAPAATTAATTGT